MDLFKNDPDVAVRGDAGCFLGTLGADGKAAIPILIERLKKPDYPRNIPVYIALTNFGARASDALPVLRRILADPKRIDECVCVLNVLSKIGTDARVAGPEIVKLLQPLPGQSRKRFLNLRPGLVLTLSEIEPDASLVVPALISLLREKPEKHDDRDSRDTMRRTWRYAASCLKSYGDSAKPAVPAIIAAMKENKISGEHAGAVLSAIGSDSIVAELIQLLDSAEVDTRASAAAALGQIGAAATEAVPFLEKVAKGKRGASDRIEAAAALKKIDPNRN